MAFAWRGDGARLARTEARVALEGAFASMDPRHARTHVGPVQTASRRELLNAR